MSGAATGQVETGTAGNSGAGASGAIGATGQGASGSNASQGTNGAASQSTSSGGATSGGSQNTTTVANDWTGDFTPEAKGMVQNKGWKGPKDLLDSYSSLEKLVGAPQHELVRIPKHDDKAGIEKMYTQLGRPQTPDGYKLAIPKENADPAFAKWAGEKFHELGLSKDQGEKLVESWNGYQDAARKNMTDGVTAKINAQVESLKKEWGAAYDNNIAIAKNAARTFGVEPSIIDGMEKLVGYDKTMKFFNNVGSKIGEGRFIPGSSPINENGPLTPEQAKNKIASLKKDTEWTKRFVAGGAKEVSEMHRLTKFAHPEGA